MERKRKSSKLGLIPDQEKRENKGGKVIKEIMTQNSEQNDKTNKIQWKGKKTQCNVTKSYNWKGKEKFF